MALAESPSPSPTPTPSAPDLPSLPRAINTSGDYNVSLGTIQSHDNRQGQYQNGYTTYYGGGDYKPVDSPDQLTLTVGQPDSMVTLSPQGNPLSSVFASASETVAQDPVFTDSGLIARGSINLTSLVKLTARDQAAADALRQYLGVDGGIASIVGRYHLDGVGTSAQSGVGAFTGLATLDPSLQKSFGIFCATDGYFGSPDACMKPGTGNAAYTLKVNFVPGSAYADGDPLSFYSSYTLAAFANAGPHGLGYSTGIASAFIDPQIFFSHNLDLADYTLDVSGVSAPLLAMPAVPEPASWALLLVGFAAIGGARRRHPSSPSFASTS